MELIKMDVLPLKTTKTSQLLSFIPSFPLLLPPGKTIAHSQKMQLLTSYVPDEEPVASFE